MSSYAGGRDLPREGPSTGLLQKGLDRVLAAEIHISKELWIYGSLIALAALLRFSNLGTRALHHDESLHATYSWYLAHNRGYVHDPLMHGPFLFHVTAFVYLLFGASDATSRFVPALFGTALVFLPYFLRPWLGRVGALAVAVFIAISPSLLYYARFIRDDPFVLFFTLGLVACIFRFRNSGRSGWLYTASLLLSLSFCSMEITFIIAAILLVYLDGMTAAKMAEAIARHKGLSPGAQFGVFLALLPVAWLGVVLWPAIARLREQYGLAEMPTDGTMLLVLGLLTAPQFAAAIRVPLKSLLHYDITQAVPVTWFGQHMTRAEATGYVTVIVLLAISFLFGLGWDQRRWLICALIFYVPYFLLYTTFLTNRDGWGSGIWGSLYYWLDQQDVRRGTQPVFYYAMTLSSYEYLVMGLAAAGIVAQAIRRGLDNIWLLAFAIALVPVAILVNDRSGNARTIPIICAAIAFAVAAMRGDPLRQFFVLYFGALFFGLSVAGEKMPWLTEHPALPLTVLAGMAIGDAWGALLEWPPRLRGGAACVLAALVGLAALLAWVLATRGVGDGVRLAAALLAALTLVALGALLWRLARQAAVAGRLPMTRGVLTMLAAAVFVGFFGILTVRTDWRLNWVHPDTPDEMLIYTQSSPDIPKVAKLIDQYARESGEGHKLRVTIDSADAFTWPWAWYLRDYPNTGFPDLSAYANNPALAASLNPGPVLVVNAVNQVVANQFAGQYATGLRMHHRWWFPEDGYRGVTTNFFLEHLRDGSEPSRWWGYITNRDGFSVPPSDISPSKAQAAAPASPAVAVGRSPQGTEYLGAIDSIVYFPSSWVPGMGLSSAPGTSPASAKRSGSTLTFGVAGVLAGQLRRPAGVAVDPQGNVYVADSQNNRVQKFDAEGKFLAQTGDPASRLQLQEPWGVAVSSDGSVYVADTWNHRIVKLDTNLQFVKTWGTPGVAEGSSSSPLQFFGPRGVAVDAAGTLWVTDTGNGRVLHFDAEGKPLGAFGMHGRDRGQFDEPVGLAIAPDGTIFVADTWNNRIQFFDRTFTYQGEFKADSWVSDVAGRDQENKPYLAALADGTLLATFPAGRSLVQFDRTGKVLRSSSVLPGLGGGLRDPLGVSAASDGSVLISDGVLNEIVRLPLASLP